MRESVEAALKAQNLKFVRQIQAALDQQEHTTLRACGLTEEEAQCVAKAKLVEGYYVEDEGEFRDRFLVGKLSPIGSGILSAGEVEASYPAKPLPASTSSRIFRVLGKGLWELAKIFVAGLFGWWLRGKQ